MTRSNWDETWMHVSYAIAQRSLCDRDQVGAVIVTSDNSVVSVGYNGPPSGFDHGDETCFLWCPRTTKALPSSSSELCPGYTDCPSLHAEANALSVCDRTHREGGTLYITSAPCYGCAKLIANSGITHVVFAMNDRSRGRMSRGSQKALYFLEDCGIDCRAWSEPNGNA